MFINPVPDQSNSGKVRVLAARPSDGLRKRAGVVDKLAVVEADDSNEDVLVMLFVGEWSSTVSLSTQSRNKNKGCKHDHMGRVTVRVEI